MLPALAALPGLIWLLSDPISAAENPGPQPRHAAAELDQVPSWSREDLEFFLHGSMSTEIAPETVLRAFIRTYPDLFPSQDLSHLGLIPDPEFGWPVGFSRNKVPHLGGLSAVGINCASCHVAEVLPEGGGAPVRILGVTSLFDAEAFFGTLIVATFRTADPANMERFLAAYLAVNDPVDGERMQGVFATEWQRQKSKIVTAMADDPSGSEGLAAGALHPISGDELRLDHRLLATGLDLAALAHSTLQLFHNMRAALHFPDQPPDKAPPASGFGRNDAFGLLSAALFGVPQPSAPVKYGVVWNLDQRHWVHWDGNTQSPLGRNILAALGLGAPLEGKRGHFDFALVERHTTMTDRIRSPRYPFAIDRAAASRGAAHFHAQCAACHEGPETDARLYSPADIGTDPNRAAAFTQQQADRFNDLLARVQTPGYTAPKQPGIRGTQKYWSPTLAGVWARSPYLHNGSVRTMQELLAPPAARAKIFHRGSRVFDPARLGYTDEGAYALDTSTAGNSNAGHDYGTALSSAEKLDLIEFLKTL